MELLRFKEFVNESNKEFKIVKKTIDINEAFKIGKGWNEFEGENLPKGALKIMKDKDGWKGGGGWVLAYYKGDDPEKAKEWIIATDDGDYYKVDAQFMIWSKEYAKAAWSGKSLYDMIADIMKGKNPKDPDYQT